MAHINQPIVDVSRRVPGRHRPGRRTEDTSPSSAHGRGSLLVWPNDGPTGATDELTSETVAGSSPAQRPLMTTTRIYATSERRETLVHDVGGGGENIRPRGPRRYSRRRWSGLEARWPGFRREVFRRGGRERRRQEERKARQGRR